MNVAVVGASDDPAKYAYRAFILLKEKNHKPFAVNPALSKIGSDKVYASISDITEPIDTVTLYVSAKISSKLAPEILAKSPRRIIFNPGAENESLETQARQNGIQPLEACTLVLLTTGQF